MTIRKDQLQQLSSLFEKQEELKKQNTILDQMRQTSKEGHCRLFIEGSGAIEPIKHLTLEEKQEIVLKILEVQTRVLDRVNADIKAYIISKEI